VGRNWGDERVHYLNEDGQSRYMPTSWTDIAEPDPFTIVSSGRSVFRTVDLLSLVKLVRELMELGQTKAPS